MKKHEAGRRNAGELVRRFRQLTASSTWRQIDAIGLNFPTFHPQGLAKVNDEFYLSAVEIVEPTKKFADPQAGFDRTTGAGIGHLFHFDSSGNLKRETGLGEGSIYHPGGIDYDSDYLWVPVAEYRPHSRSIIYRVEPDTLKVDEIFRCNEHIGGLAHDRLHKTLHGISWGSRKFYAWHSLGNDAWRVGQDEPACRIYLNGSHYVDYQDCHFVDAGYMLCSGLKDFSLPHGGRMRLGGLDLVDLERHVAVHQVPVPLYSNTGRPMTQNPFWVELHGEHLRFYFVPDDHESTLYIYEVLP